MPPSIRSAAVLEVIDKGGATATHPTPLLFVHGAFHGAWCWDDHFLDYFADRGYHALALNLRGHGGSPSSLPINSCSVLDYVEDVSTVADRLPTAPVVIGHSMGATLAAHVIDRIGASGSVNTFIGIAGAFRGLYTCGIYPYNVANSTCGSWGLSIGSPLLNGLAGRRFGARMYSFKSYSDEINCATGVCIVYGVHTSQIQGETGSYTFPYGHYGLLWYTASQQVGLL